MGFLFYIKVMVFELIYIFSFKKWDDELEYMAKESLEKVPPNKFECVDTGLYTACTQIN